MAEEAIKQRLYRAINNAIKILDNPPGTCKIIKLDGKAFHIESVRKKEVRKIRIVLDEITNEDEKIVQEIKFPSIITKEIWLKKFKEREFETREIL